MRTLASLSSEPSLLNSAISAKIMGWLILILLKFLSILFIYLFIFFGGGGGDNDRPTLYGYTFIWDNGAFIQAGLEDLVTGHVEFSLI